MSAERLARELAALREGGQVVELVAASGAGGPAWPQVVLYRAVPTAVAVAPSLPTHTDVVVPVPAGYPAAMIDLAGLPEGSTLLPHLRGGTNSQGILIADGRRWQLASYHPHNGGGGPPWDQTRHGFHTYLGHLLSWLARLH